LGLYTRRLHPTALLIGWATGIAAATWMVFSTGFAAVFPLHLGSSVIPGAIVFYSLLLNLIVTMVLTWVFNLAKLEAGNDLTTAGDYA
jgi:SSS family solute:Na+ symporter